MRVYRPAYSELSNGFSTHRPFTANHGGPPSRLPAGRHGLSTSIGPKIDGGLAKIQLDCAAAPRDVGQQQSERRSASRSFGGGNAPRCFVRGRRVGMSV